MRPAPGARTAGTARALDAGGVLLSRRPGELAEAERVARAALTLDADADGGALVRRLASPPADRRWTALLTDGGVAMASVSTRDPAVGHLDLLAVHPDAQGRGRGRALARAAEEWLRAEGVTQARIAGHPPCYAWPGIDVRYTAAACLAESLGYERYHVAWNMTADLSADLSVEDDLRRLAEAGVTVRAIHTARTADLPKTSGTADTADAGAAETAGAASAAGGDRERLAAFVREHWNDNWAWEATHAAGVHYAERDGAILGFAAWGAHPAWFGPMGTAPQAQGMGVGRVLLRRCLADQRAAGQATAQIGWVGPLRFYSRAVGARAERVFWLYRRDLA